MPAIDLHNLPDARVTVSQFIDLLNETYEFAFPSIVISGELANLRVSKNRWVYFDLKDERSSLKFFGTVYQLPGPLEDGMLLHVRGAPHMHDLYGFSVNVQTITPYGEGSIRRAAELLMRKLEAEGLFDAARKRQLPYPPRRIGLVTSSQSAAYADFIKILNARWGGLDIELLDVQVQGEAAPPQLIAAIQTFNTMADPPDVLVLIRGGGSADDLAAFSHEQVARAVAASRVPVLAAIGHEIDTSLAELAADLRASTPSNAAELLVPDKQVVLRQLSDSVERLRTLALDRIHQAREENDIIADSLHLAVQEILAGRRTHLETSSELLQVLSPHAALRRGYAILRNEAGQATQTAAPGDIVRIELLRKEVTAQVRTTREIRDPS